MKYDFEKKQSISLDFWIWNNIYYIISQFKQNNINLKIIQM